MLYLLLSSLLHFSKVWLPSFQVSRPTLRPFRKRREAGMTSAFHFEKKVKINKKKKTEILTSPIAHLMFQVEEQRFKSKEETAFS
jgi:hypothetical protein